MKNMFFSLKGIEALSLKYKSSLRGQEDRNAIEKDKIQLSYSTINDFFHGDHITAQGLGIEMNINSQTSFSQPVITVSLMNFPNYS